MSNILDIEGDMIAKLIKQLKDAFGGLTVYDAPVRQGLRTPSFQILTPRLDHVRLMGGIGELNYLFNLNFFPESDSPAKSYDEMRAIRTALPFHLRYIGGEGDETYHVDRFESVIVDDVLVTTFAAKKQVRIEEIEVLMESLDYDIEMKED